MLITWLPVRRRCCWTSSTQVIMSHFVGIFVVTCISVACMYIVVSASCGEGAKINLSKLGIRWLPKSAGITVLVDSPAVAVGLMELYSSMVITIHHRGVLLSTLVAWRSSGWRCWGLATSLLRISTALRPKSFNVTGSFIGSVGLLTSAMLTRDIVLILRLWSFTVDLPAVGKRLHTKRRNHLLSTKCWHPAKNDKTNSCCNPTYCLRQSCSRKKITELNLHVGHHVETSQ